MPEVAYVNGRVVPLARARVSVEDRGFQFGDGVYELIRSYQGRLFRVPEHITRLQRSAAAINLPLPLAPEALRAAIDRLYQRGGFPDGQIYVQLTRGVAPRQHLPPDEPVPTLVMTARALAPVPEGDRTQGVAVITMPDIRWGRCDIKSINLLPNILMKQQARRAGAYEAVLLRDGRVTEGTSSNLFVVEQGRLHTPSQGPEILGGITRDDVLALARQLRLEVLEAPVPEELLRGAREVFLTATTVGLLPVTRIDGVPVGPGEPGEITKLLVAEFRQLTGSSP